MTPIHMILIVFAIVLEAVAFAGIPTNRWNLIAGGLMFYFLSLLF